MAQHDYEIENDSGLNVRTDINNALLAIVSNNSGTTEPAETFPYMWWADTTSGFLKVRNAADSDWVTVGALASFRLGLGAPYASGSDPAAFAYAFMLWIDTSGSPDLLKIRNSANNAWITIGTVESANFGLLPLSGGTMSSAISFSNTDYTNVPVGTTAQRPVSPAEGMVRYNTDLDSFEFYNGSAWVTGGGGGGQALEWETDVLAPTSTLQNFMRLWAFAAGEGQALYALYKVPSSYTAGQQINLRALFMSGDTSGTVLFQTVATLIRTGQDAYTSTTNQRTSTNAAVTVSAGTVNEPQGITCDLTSSSGQINSVAVSAGDLILIKLTRGTDTATGDAYFFPQVSEVK